MLLVLAVVAGALAEPAREDGLDREIELLVRVVGKSRPVSALTIALNSPTRSCSAAASRSVSCSAPCARLGRVERVVEALAADLHHDPPEHLDEAAVRVPAEALVAGQRDQPCERLLVQARG